MKTIPAGVRGTLVFGCVIERTDGEILAWTDHDKDLDVTVDGEARTLLANPGFNVQSLVSTAGLGVDNTEIQVVAGEDMTRADILARKWDGAQVYFFRCSWKYPNEDVIPVKRGSFGDFKPEQGGFAVEFRDMRQGLQQSSTWVLQEACRWRLGDARCDVDLAPFTFDAAVTTAGTQYAFTASALVQADDYFGEGFVTWTTGPNVGTPGHKVKSFSAGVVTLSEAAIYEIGLGDEFTIVAGCRKRKAEDCITKFDNVLNFGGEADKPTRDELIRPATA